MKKCIVCDDTISGQKKLYCSNKCKQKHHYDRVKEQTNTYHSQTIRAYRRKVYLIDIRTLSNRSMKYILEEISKCDLLCSNCHREYHNPELGVEEIRELVEKNESSSRVS